MSCSYPLKTGFMVQQGGTAAFWVPVCHSVPAAGLHQEWLM